MGFAHRGYLGFLDGGDRMMVLASRADQSLAGSDNDSSITDSFVSTISSDNSSISSTNVVLPATASLLVTNLPTVLFSELSDLNPLLRPFGSIQTLQILSSESGSNLISAVVEYKTLAEAQDAKAFLHGQLYAGFRLELEYIQVGVPVQPSTCGRTSFSGSGNRKRTSPLNPLAAPFVVESHINLFNSSIDPNRTHSRASEFKPYRQFCILPPGLPAAAQAQNHGPYSYQYPTRAIPTDPFTYPDAYCITPDDSMGMGSLSSSISSVWVDSFYSFTLWLIYVYPSLQVEFPVPF